jgi:hypothetical protein
MEKVLIIPYREVTIIQGFGTDKILIKMTIESPYPVDVQDYGVCEISTKRGYGPEYCEKVLQISDYKVIESS